MRIPSLDVVRPSRETSPCNDRVVLRSLDPKRHQGETPGGFSLRLLCRAIAVGDLRHRRQITEN